MELYQDSTLGSANAAVKAVHYQELHDEELRLPKGATGDGDDELKELGTWVIDNMVQLSVDAIRKPAPALGNTLAESYEKYGPDFEFVVTPDIGALESYVGAGIGCGAAADGRRNGMLLASDMSPVPASQDLPAEPKHWNIYRAI